MDNNYQDEWVFGKRLKNKRKQKGLTQEKLASILNVSPQVISNWERGYTRSVDASIFSQITLVLNCSPGELLGNHPSVKEKTDSYKALDPEEISADVLKLMTAENIKKLNIIKDYSVETIEKIAQLVEQARKEKTSS